MHWLFKESWCHQPRQHGTWNSQSLIISNGGGKKSQNNGYLIRNLCIYSSECWHLYTNSIRKEELYISLKQISITSNCHHVHNVNVQANNYIITNHPSLFSFIISTLCVSCSGHAYPSVFIFPKILFLHFSHSLSSFCVTYNLPSGTWISNFTGFKEGGRTLVCGAALAKVLPFIGNLCKMELSNSKHMHSVLILRQFLAHSHWGDAKLHLLASPYLKRLVSWAATLCCR